MTIGIYSITHRDSGKRYIGKSINIESRLWQHKNLLTKPERSKDCNRHLYNAVQKHGWETFRTETIEEFDWVDERHIAARELFWMDHFQTCDRGFGYNLRRDSSTKMEVHAETRALQSMQMRGEGNPNFGNLWSDDQRERMSVDRRKAHALGESYGDEWRSKISAASTLLWLDQDKKDIMAKKVGLKKQRYDYLQYSKDGQLLRRYSTVAEIVEVNPGYKWQNIYSACHGHKQTYMNFIWRQVSRIHVTMLLLVAAAA